MTLLSIAQDVAGEVGVVEPASLVGNADLTAKRLLACAKAEGEALYRAHNWSILQREYTFETTASTANYPVPEDFGRLLRATAWDRTQYRKMHGAVTPEEWQRLKSSQVANASITRRIRLLSGPLAGSILIDPTPTATGDDLVYEYVSNWWCESSGGDGQATWTADADNFRLDLELFRLGLLWRAKRALGLAYADDRADYDMALRDAIKADLALDVISMVRRPFRPVANVAEGNFLV